MAFNKEFVFYVIEALTSKKSEYLGSFKPQNKFSDVANYIREFKLLGKSTAGRVAIDTDNGRNFNFEYHFGANKRQWGFYDVKIFHVGDVIVDMEVRYFNAGAAYMTKQAVIS